MNPGNGSAVAPSLSTIPPHSLFKPMAFTMTMNLFGDERYSLRHPEYLRVAEAAAQLAIAEWLQGIDREQMHLFEVDGVECALECFTGHWGTDARWRWGRTAAGDPDEDDSGEDILLDVALGRKVARPDRRRRVGGLELPPYAEGDLYGGRDQVLRAGPRHGEPGQARPAPDGLTALDLLDHPPGFARLPNVTNCPLARPCTPPR